MVGTLKPCLVEKNLFEPFAITGGRDEKTLHMSHLVEFPLPNFNFRISCLKTKIIRSTKNGIFLIKT